MQNNRKKYSPKQMADILGIDHQVMRKMLFDYKSVVKEIPLTINDKEINTHGYKYYDIEGLMTVRLILTYKSIGVSRSKIIRTLKDNKHDRMSILDDQLKLLKEQQSSIDYQNDLIKTLKCIGPNDNFLSYYIDTILNPSSSSPSDKKDELVERLLDPLSTNDWEKVKKAALQLSKEKGRNLQDAELRKEAEKFLSYVGSLIGWLLPSMVLEFAKIFPSITANNLNSSYDTSTDFEFEFLARLLMSIIDEHINHYVTISNTCKEELISLTGVDISDTRVKDIVKRLYLAAKQYMYVRNLSDITDIMNASLSESHSSNDYDDYIRAVFHYYFIDNPKVLDEYADASETETSDKTIHTL